MLNNLEHKMKSIQQIEKEVARDFVVRKGKKCFCYNQYGCISPAIDYHGHLFTPSGEKLEGKWEKIVYYDITNVIISALCAFSLITLIVLVL